MASCVDQWRNFSQHPQSSYLPPPPPSSTPTRQSLEIPVDVLFNILSILSTINAVRFGKTCYSWHRISHDFHCQSSSKRTLSLTRRHDSHHTNAGTMIKTCTINKGR
ncbi:hypothetical protein E1A91_A05G337900v1 [Gossypium mustelinum]|uniref:F-box domain-containing protein n=1 Tax=Gossypium mustelinum TaxID=34275 RepID=A0A5D2ZCX0_GOSMU|nr:hypothetical protein E1A91_A05G337900v1 [Gossypium mustelinum]